MTMLKKIAAFLAALGDGIMSGLFKALWQCLTGRNLDAEQAGRDEEERQRLATERQHDEVEARHRETLAAAAEQAAEMRELRQQLAGMAERRERQERFRREHDDAARIRKPRRPSLDEDDPEPDYGAPLCPVPA